jgi:hypothetical protein
MTTNATATGAGIFMTIYTPFHVPPNSIESY